MIIKHRKELEKTDISSLIKFKKSSCSETVYFIL